MRLNNVQYFGTSAGRVIATASFAIAFTLFANAQWTVVNLHPAGATESKCYGVSGGQQVGYAEVAGSLRASLWSGTAASWVNLHPGGAGSSEAYGVGGGQQAGSADANASLWSSTAASWVDLNPFGADYSMALAVDGGRVVGRSYVGGTYRASLWNGTAASWVDLSPAGTENSFAFGLTGDKQVGAASYEWLYHAGLWSGTAASWVDLNPIGSGQSFGRGVSGDQQVGIATFNTLERAALWTGTAASFVNLHPAAATTSAALAVHGGQQVGVARYGSSQRACLWSGTAASLVNLHALLPANFTSSRAEGITHEGGFTYVVGSGFNSTSNRDEALMWVYSTSTPVLPTSYAILQGLNFGGNLASLFNSDNDKVYVLCDEFDSNGEIQFDSTLPAGTVNQLKFKFEGSASRNDLSQFVRMFNYSTNAYTTVSFQTATIIDSVVEGTITTGVANYYSGAREVKSRVFWVPQADIDASDGWSQSCDQVLWTIN